MMHQPRRNITNLTLFSAGWLFADLLLALMMLFLASNASAISQKPKPTPMLVTPPTIITVTPQKPPLAANYFPADLHFNFTNVYSGDSNALQGVRNQILNELSKFLQCKAGLVLIFVSVDSTDDANQVGQADKAAGNIVSTMKELGKNNLIFDEAQYHPPGTNHNGFGNAQIQVYFFANPSTCEPSPPLKR